MVKLLAEIFHAGQERNNFGKLKVMLKLQLNFIDIYQTEGSESGQGMLAVRFLWEWMSKSRNVCSLQKSCSLVDVVTVKTFAVAKRLLFMMTISLTKPLLYFPIGLVKSLAIAHVLCHSCSQNFSLHKLTRVQKSLYCNILFLII